MKTTALLRRYLSIAGSAVLAVPLANAATLYWDVDGSGVAGFGTVVGTWNTTNNFWNTDIAGSTGGSVTNTTTSADDLIISQATTNTGSITVTGTQSASSITFAPNVGPTTNITTNTIIIGGIGASSGIFQQSSGANTISSALTLNSANTAFNFSNSSTGLLTIGAVTGAATSGTQTITVGASSAGGITLGGIIGNGAGGGNVALTINSSGTGETIFSGANTFTGQLKIERGVLSIASINNASANGTLGNNNLNQPIILGSSGGNTGTLKYTAASGSSDKSFTLAAGGTGAFDVTTALSISGPINGGGNLLKTGAGTLTLNMTTDNYFLGIQNQFTGVTQITGGKIKLVNLYNNAAYGQMLGLQKSVFDTTGTSASVGLDVTKTQGSVVTSILWLGGLAGNVDLATAATGYVHATNGVAGVVLNPQSGTTASYSGVIGNGTGNTYLTKAGPGSQTFTAAQSYTGATTIYEGTLALSGAGSILTSAVTVAGGTLDLDNSGGSFISRLADATALSLGSLTLKSYNGAGVRTETVGATTFATSGKVTINNGTTGGDQTTLAMGAVTRSAGAAIDFVGTNGTLGSGANGPNVTSTGAWAGAQNSILPWATVGGTSWGEDNANSIRAYSGSFTTLAAATNTTQSQQTGAASLAGALNTNSLNVISDGSSNILDLGNNIVSFGSTNVAGTIGAILKSGANPYTISASGSGSLRSGTGGAGTELIAHVDGGALTISATLSTTIESIAKGGTGNLILSGARDATLNGAIGIAGGSLEFQGLTTTLSGVMSGPGKLVVNLNSGQMLTISNNANSFSGGVLVKGGVLITQDGMPTVSTAAGGYTGNGGMVSFGGLSNIELNGGVLAYTYKFGRHLGTGPDQIQITGGVSGFSSRGQPLQITGTNNYEVVWGSDYFKPTTLVLNDAVAATSAIDFANKLDLNGATRTVTTDHAIYGATISGVIRNSNGTAGLTKTGVGTLTLSGANTYNGALTVSAGTLILTGANTSSSAANITGGTLQLGTGSTTGALGASSTVTIGSSAVFAINRSNAVTQGTDFGSAAITGLGGITKFGAGTLTLNAANNYSGPTTLVAGTLSIAAANNLGNAASNLVFNGGILQITGTALNDFADLGRTVVFTPGFAVGLDINNASNIFTFDQALPTAGLRLSGAGAVAFQNTVSALTLNVETGGTATLVGAIANGASGMSLTKIGAGTQVLQGANSYTGATTISAGTLTLSGSGSINASSGIVIQGGTLSSTSTTTGTTPFGAQSLDFKHGALTIAPASAGAYAFTGVNAAVGSTLTYSGGTSLTLTRNGTNTLTYTIGNAGATANTVLVRSGNGTMVFNPTALANMGGSAAGSENFIINNQTAASNMNGASTGTGIYSASVVAAASNVGTFLSYGTGAGGLSAGFAQAVYTTRGTGGVTLAANEISDITASIAVNTASNPYALRVGAFTLTNSGTTTVNGGAASGTNSGLGGVILNSTATASTITGGILDFGSSEGVIFAASSGAGNGTISSQISGSAGITKFGLGTLVLGSASNNFTGGVRVNQGVLQISANTHLGNASNSITFNGSATLRTSGSTTLGSTRTITVADGAIATLQPTADTFTINGAITGSGGVTFSNSTNSGPSTVTSTSTGNNFTGPLTIGILTGDISVNIASLTDGIGYGNIIFDSTNNQNRPASLTYTGAGALDLQNRQIVISSTAGNNLNPRIRSNGGAITIARDLQVTSSAAITFQLGGTSANSNLFSGKIANGNGTISLSVDGSIWNLSGANSYTGTTTVSAGTLGFANGSLGSSGTINASGGTLLWLPGNTQDISSRLAMTAATTSTFHTNGNNVTFASAIGSSTTGALTKTGLGTLTLGGTNSYTGTTTLNAGTLKLDYAATNTTKLADTSGILALNGGTLELSGGSHTELVTSTTLNTGGTFVTQPSGTSTLSMGAITFTGGAIDFAENNIATTSTAVTNGILSQRATVAGANFAMKSGSNIVAYDYATSGSTGYTGGAMVANTNYALQTAGGANTLSGTTGATTNTLKIANTATGSLAVGANTLTMGAILYAGSANYDITTSGTGRVTPTVLHNYGTGGAVLNLGALGGALTQFGTGKTILTSAAQNAAGVTVNGGTVQFSNNDQIGTPASGTGITLNNGTLLASADVALNNAGSNHRTITLGAGGGTLAAASTKTLTVSGVISGALNPLTVGNASSTGTVTLSGTNTYTGATLVSAGTLFISGSLASDVTVSDGATLAGGGTVDDLILGGGSLFDIFLAVGSSDSLTATNISFAASGFGIDNLRANGSVVDWGIVSDGVYTLIAGTLNSTNLENFGSGNAYNIGGGRSAYFQNGSLQLVVIPEPKTALLGVLGVLLILRRRR